MKGRKFQSWSGCDALHARKEVSSAVLLNGVVSVLPILPATACWNEVSAAEYKALVQLEL